MIRPGVLLGKLIKRSGEGAAKIDALDARVNALDEKLDETDDRVDDIETKVEANVDVLENHEKRITELEPEPPKCGSAVLAGTGGLSAAGTVTS